MSFFAALISVVVSIYSVWYLFPSSRPRPGKKRAASITALLIIFLVPMLRETTGWSPAWCDRPGADLFTAVFAYLGLITAFWLLSFGGKLDLAGKAISALLLVAAFVKPMKVVFLGMFGGWALSGQCLTSVRVDATHSYMIFDDQALIGAAHYTACVTYQNPRWFPFIHRRIGNGMPGDANCPSVPR